MSQSEIIREYCAETVKREENESEKDYYIRLYESNKARISYHFNEIRRMTEPHFSSCLPSLYYYRGKIGKEKH